MSAAKNIRDNWPTLTISLLGCIIIPLVIFRFNNMSAQRDEINIRLDKKADKTWVDERFVIHEEADKKEYLLIIEMLKGLDKKTDRIEDRLNSKK